MGAIWARQRSATANDRQVREQIYTICVARRVPGPRREFVSAGPSLLLMALEAGARAPAWRLLRGVPLALVKFKRQNVLLFVCLQVLGPRREASSAGPSRAGQQASVCICCPRLLWRWRLINVLACKCMSGLPWPDNDAVHGEWYRRRTRIRATCMWFSYVM